MKIKKYLIPLTILTSITGVMIPTIASCSNEATITYIGQDKYFSCNGSQGSEILYFQTNAKTRTMADAVSFKIKNNSSTKLNISASDFAWDSFKNGTFHCILNWSFKDQQTGSQSESAKFDLRLQYYNIEELSSCADITFKDFNVSLYKN